MSTSRPTDAHAEARIAAAAHAFTEAWAVYRAVRDDHGRVVDLEIRYANPAYGDLAGADPAELNGRRLSELSPGIDWSRGLAARHLEALGRGGVVEQPGVTLLVQVGRWAGRERTFDLEYAVADDDLVIRFRDVTERQAAEREAAVLAARSRAVAAFLGAAMSPSSDDRAVLRRLTREIAGALGGMAGLSSVGSAGSVRLVAAAGGPPDVLAQVRRWRSGRTVRVPHLTACSPSA